MGGWSKRTSHLPSFSKKEDTYLCFQAGKHKAYLYGSGVIHICGIHFVTPMTEKSTWLHHIPHLGEIENIHEGMDAIQEGVKLLFKKCPWLSQINLYDDAYVKNTNITWTQVYLLLFGKTWCDYELGAKPFHIAKQKEMDSYYQYWVDHGLQEKATKRYNEHGVYGLIEMISDIPYQLSGLSWFIPREKIENRLEEYIAKIHL
jgi:hypothetical protein